MQRRKQIDYQSKQNIHEDYDYEFAYELGAEIMKNNLQRKDDYLNKLNQRENNRQNSNQNRMENDNEFVSNDEMNRQYNQSNQIQNKNMKQRQKNNIESKNSINRVEFSNNETMRPLRQQYYASQDYEPMDEHEDFLIEKQSQKNDNNFRKR